VKVLVKIAGLGLLTLGSGTALAQYAGAGPGATPLTPNANGVASTGREQTESFTHVMNNLDRQKVVTKGAVSKATAADITVGAPLRDVNGQPIGKIGSVDPDGVVIDSGQAKVKVPLVAFGKDNKGLLLGITSAKFAELVAKAHAGSAAPAPAQPTSHPATAADVVAGAALRDVNGQTVGKITGVSADGATVDTGKTKVKLPLDAFGVDGSGLLIGISAQKLDEIIAQAAASGKKQQ
jgi:hypothetical protein